MLITILKNDFHIFLFLDKCNCKKVTVGLPGPPGPQGPRGPPGKDAVLDEKLLEKFRGMIGKQGDTGAQGTTGSPGLSAQPGIYSFSKYLLFIEFERSRQLTVYTKQEKLTKFIFRPISIKSNFSICIRGTFFGLKKSRKVEFIFI